MWWQMSHWRALSATKTPARAAAAAELCSCAGLGRGCQMWLHLAAGAGGPWLNRYQLVQLIDGLFALADQIWPRCAVEAWDE